jgi:hypothetical protein
MLDDATWDPEEMLSTLSLWATGLMEKGGSPDPEVDEVDEVAPEDPKEGEMKDSIGHEEIMTIAETLDDGISAIDKATHWINTIESRSGGGMLLNTLGKDLDALEDIDIRSTLKILRAIRNRLVRPGSTDRW